jgi:hypothetical protein
VLKLADCDGLTSAVRFDNLPGLRKCVLSNTRNISDASVASNRCDRLRSLALACTGITSAVRFDHLQALEELDLTDTAVADRTMLHLPLSVKQLKLIGSNHLTERCNISHLHRLGELELDGSNGFAALTAPHTLWILCIRSTYALENDKIARAVAHLRDMGCYVEDEQ